MLLRVDGCQSIDAGHVRGFDPLRDHSHLSPAAGAMTGGASMGFFLQGHARRAGSSSRRPAPHAVPLRDRPLPRERRYTGSPPGALVRARVALQRPLACPCGAPFLDFDALQSMLPPAPAHALVTCTSPLILGRLDVFRPPGSQGLWLRARRRAPLGSSPALLGFITFRFLAPRPKLSRPRYDLVAIAQHVSPPTGPLSHRTPVWQATRGAAPTSTVAAQRDGPPLRPTLGGR